MKNKKNHNKKGMVTSYIMSLGLESKLTSKIWFFPPRISTLHLCFPFFTLNSFQYIVLFYHKNALMQLMVQYIAITWTQYELLRQQGAHFARRRWFRFWEIVLQNLIDIIAGQWIHAVLWALLSAPCLLASQTQSLALWSSISRNPSKNLAFSDPRWGLTTIPISAKCLNKGGK